MTKVELIAKVAADAELTKKDAEKAVNAVLEGITAALKAGDKVAVREKSKSLEAIASALATRKSYDWLVWNDAVKEGTFVTVPERVQIPENIKEQLIVELYSK